MVLPEELGSWRTQLQDATDQALTLIQRGWSCGKVKLTDPNAAEGELRKNYEHTTQWCKHCHTYTQSETHLPQELSPSGSYFYDATSQSLTFYHRGHRG